MKVIMKVIIVTGCAGDTGSYLCDLLLKDKNNFIIGVDNFFRGNMYNMSKYINNRRFMFLNGDIQNFYTSSSGFLNLVFFKKNSSYKNKAQVYGIHFSSSGLLRSENCEEIHIKGCIVNTVYNLAAVVPTKYFYESPDLTYKVNCQAAIALFDYCRFLGIKNFLNASSSEIYGHNALNANEFSDQHYDSPESSVRWSYAHGKILTEYYMNKFSDVVKVVHLRYANCAGSHDIDTNHVLPYFIDKLMKGQSVRMNKKPDEFTRSYLAMEDAAEATIACMEKGISGHAYNIGTNEEISVQDLFIKCCNALKIDPSTVKVSKTIDRPGDPRRRVLDISRVSSEVGWEPRFDLDYIIKSIIKEKKKIDKSKKEIGDKL